MNFLLTGGLGLHTAATAIALAQAGHRLLLLDNSLHHAPALADHIRQVIGVSPPVEVGQLHETVRLKLMLRHYAIGAVVHTVAPSPREATTSPLAHYHQQVGGAIGLLRAMTDVRVHRLVALFIPPTAQGQPLATSRAYSHAAQQVEQLLNDVAAQEPHWQVTQLRPNAPHAELPAWCLQALASRPTAFPPLHAAA